MRSVIAINKETNETIHVESYSATFGDKINTGLKLYEVIEIVHTVDGKVTHRETAPIEEVQETTSTQTTQTSETEVAENETTASKINKLIDTLETNGYAYYWNVINRVARYAGHEGAYTFLIYFAKHINPTFAKGHKLPEVTHSLITCNRCNGNGGSSKWNHTGHTCYKCNGKKKVLGSQQAFRSEMKALAESLTVLTMDEARELAKKAKN